MFLNINLGVVSFAFPDVCKVPTPIGPVPLPFPNITLSFTHVPSQFKVIVGGGLAENMMTMGTISNGDEPGVLGGIISNVFIGPDRPLLGSLRVFIEAALAMRMTALNGHNGMPMNIVGMSLTPAQFRVLILS